jgi:ABC-2 type transport system ATP-binding protein
MRTTDPAAPPAAIACHDLTKRFGQLVALDRLNLELAPGIVFGFLGPNGAGKTTAMRLLTGLARPTAGEASIAGVGVRDGEPVRRGLIGYLDQDPRFPGWMTARELLELVGSLYGMKGPALRGRIDESLETVGLREAARRTIGGYSGGMRQRLGLAQALLNRPPVLFLDEPVSALDPEGRHDLLAVIRGLAPASTVLFSTHILSDAERICDRVVILDRGRLQVEAPIDELLARYATPLYRVALDTDEAQLLDGLAARLRQLGGVREVRVEHGELRVDLADPEAAAPALLGALGESRLPVTAFERMRPTLEEVFLRIVADAAEEAA